MAAAATLFAAALTATAQEMSQERAFPAITIIVGFAPGGGDEGGGAGRSAAARLQPQPGYDQTARLFALHLGAFLPGKPTVVLRHLPGAGSLKAASHLAHEAPRDASVLAVVSSTALIAPLTGASGADYAIDSFAFVGGRLADEYVCAVDGQSGVEDIDGLSRTAIAFGSTAPGRRPHIHASLLQTLARTPLRIVNGYRDTNELLLALRRGEIAGVCGVAFESLRAGIGSWIASGRLKPLLRFAPQGSETLRAVPRAENYARETGAGNNIPAIASFLAQEGAIAWTLSAPATIPPDRLAQLRKAFAAMQSDRAYLREAVRRNLEVSTVTPERIEAALKFMASTPEKIREHVGKLNAPP